VIRSLSDYFWLIVGALVAALGIDGFLLPNHFIDGGVTGISMLLAQWTRLPLALFLIALNSPFLLMGYRQIGRTFAVKSAMAIVALAIAVEVIPFPKATDDPLLGAVFGGFFIGAGVGLAIRNGGVLDGTEIFAVILSKRTFATVGEIILGVNVLMFTLAAFVLGAEPAMYSVLTYFTAFKTIDYLLHGIEAYNGVMIVSDKHAEIREVILSELGRGVTVLKGRGGYTKAEQNVLYCVVTRLELNRLEGLIHALDDAAFVVISPVHEVSGGTLKRRVFH
jgi:uncharacterized membrane-anchored protein YitT (DUF2179 family)